MAHRGSPVPDDSRAVRLLGPDTPSVRATHPTKGGTQHSVGCCHDRSMTAVPAKIIDVPGQVVDRAHLFDRIFFGIGALATIWLAWAIARATFKVSWWGLLLVVVFWLVLAHLALPRLNRILSSIYVPNYFIGRTRTSDGLLGDPLNLAFR